MRKLTVGSLFSGIGGIDLGLERAGMETRWFSEIDSYASRVLAKHWPHVPNHGDITKIDFATVEPVDVLAGGFPCQDISNAGRREGIDGVRSGLWSEYARAIGELRPRYVLVENVAALLYRGMDRVLGDLASCGYDAEWECVPAAAVGAPFLRDRAFVVAYSHGQHGRAGGAGRPVGVAPWIQLPSKAVRRPADRTIDGRGWWAVEPRLDRLVHGVPPAMDRIRGLGNAVVPQIPELIGGWIIEHARASGYLEDVA